MLNGMLFNGHLEEGEDISRIVHRHWLAGVAHLFWPTAVFLFLAYGIYYVWGRQNFVIALGIGEVCVLIWWLRNFFDYYLDAWIVTDHGIIDVEWHGLFHRESSRVLYSDLQGVSYEIKGIIPTILRTGTISVEKISTGSAVEMEQVYNPRSVETLILKNMEAYMLHKNMKNTKDVQEILAAIVAERAHLREIESDSDEDAE